MPQDDLPIVASVGAVAIKDGKVLLVKHGEESGHINDMYGFPAGRLEEGETELEAVAREFREETGLAASISDFEEFPNNYYIAKVPRKNNEVINFGFRAYRVKNFTGELKGEENKSFPEWVDLSEVEQFEKDGKLLPNTLNAINASRKI